MASTINGNAGGAAFSGAQIQCMNNRTQAILFAAADASGNFSFTNLPQARYIVSATFSGDVYYHPVHVSADGTSTYSGINLNPTALNASNVGAWAGNF